MSTQLKQLPDKPDWKDRYYQALNEFDEKEKNGQRKRERYINLYCALFLATQA